MPAIAAISQNACDWPECPNDWNSPSVLMNPMLLLDQQALERRALARNEVLFRQGDKVTAIYFVELGRLRLERRTFDGRPLILGTTPAGEFFVEGALFADSYRCDAVAA